MTAATRYATTAVVLILLAVSVSARRLATIPPGNDAGDNPHTCCRCKCVIPSNANATSGVIKTAVPPSNGKDASGTVAPGALPPVIPCVLPPNSPPGTGCTPPTYGKKRICKAGFVGSCDEVCLVDNGSWTSYNSC